MDELLQPIEDQSHSNEIEETKKATINKSKINKQLSLPTPEKIHHLEEIRALPFMNRLFRKIDTGSMRGVVIMWIRMTLGIGILTLPFYFKQYGAITAIFVVAFSSLMNFLSYKFIFEASSLTNKKNYPDLIETMLGKSILKIFRLTYMLDITSSMIIYPIVSWNLLEYIMYFMEIGKDHWHEWFLDINQIKYNEMNSTVFLIRGAFLYGTFIVSIPLFLKRDLESLQKITFGYLIAIFTLLIIILIEVPFYREAYKDKDIGFHLIKFPSFNWVECFFGICVSFYVQPFMFSLRGELMLPTLKRTMKIAKTTVSIETILFIILGFCGYFALGDVFTPNLLILRKPYDGKNVYSETIFRCAIGLFFVLNTIGLAMYNPSLRDYLYPFISIKNEKLKYYLISLGPFFVLTTIAFIYPYVVDVTNFFGFTVYNFNGYIIPFLIKMQTLKLQKGRFYERLLTFIAVTFFILMGVAGLTFRIMGLITI